MPPALHHSTHGCPVLDQEAERRQGRIKRHRRGPHRLRTSRCRGRAGRPGPARTRFTTMARVMDLPMESQSMPRSTAEWTRRKIPMLIAWRRSTPPRSEMLGSPKTATTPGPATQPGEELDDHDPVGLLEARALLPDEPTAHQQRHRHEREQEAENDQREHDREHHHRAPDPLQHLGRIGGEAGELLHLGNRGRRGAVLHLPRRPRHPGVPLGWFSPSMMFTAAAPLELLLVVQI